MSAADARPAIGTPTGWNCYFVVKLLLFWLGLIDLHALENLAFFIFLAVPLPAFWRRLRLVFALPGAVALLYHDSFLPPVSRVLAQADAMAGFSLAYLFELAGRFINPQIALLLAAALLALVLSQRFLRISVLVLTTLVVLAATRVPEWMPAPATLQAAGPGGFSTASPAGVPRLSQGGSSAELERILEQFYATEAGRVVRLPPPAATALPFDLLFIHVCSLSWDDVEAAGQQSHPLWKSFDIVFRRFNSAASYSGPAAVRLNRATCGQTSNDGLYAPAARQCYLMPSLKQAGYDIDFAMNHDGHFDDFLQLVRQQGIQAEPVSLRGVPVSMKGFDDSPIHDDGAVLARWQALRAASDAPRIALYYNSITLHDGNRLTGAGAAGLNSAQSYKLRLAKLLDEMEALMRALASGSRRTVVVFIPEHGAALRGDRLQIAGLREIATPAITTVPVAFKVIDPQSGGEHGTEYVDSPTSFLALSHVIAKMLENAPFGPAPFDAKPYLADLPTTEFVAENQSIIMRVENRYFWRQDSARWQLFPVDLAR